MDRLHVNPANNRMHGTLTTCCLGAVRHIAHQLCWSRCTGAVLKCYGGQSPAPEPRLVVLDIPIEDHGGTPACASYYTFRCSENAPGCSPEEIAKQGVFTWMYTAMPAAQCEQMKATVADGSLYGNVTCCLDNLCNKPDPVADPDGILMVNNGTATGDGEKGCLVGGGQSAGNIVAMCIEGRSECRKAPRY